MADDAAPGAPALSTAIEAIWVRHRELMFTRMRTIEDAVAAAAAGSLSDAARAAAHRDAHKLAGALGTFGLEEGTRHARILEYAFDGDGSIDVSAARQSAHGLRAQLESR